MDESERAQLAAKYERPAFSLSFLRLPSAKCSPRLQLALLCVVGFLFYLSTIRVPLQRCDDIYFFVGAKSIAAGKGFSDISRPDAPPQLKYPPIRALLQVPLLPLTGTSIRPLRVIGMMAIIGAMALTYPMLVSRIGHRATMWCLALTIFNPTMLRAANFEGANVLSLFWALTFLLLARAVSLKDNFQSGIWISVALALCFYTHRMGALLLPLALVYLICLHRPRAAGTVAIVAGALCLPWLLRSYYYSGHWISPEYESEFGVRIVRDSPSDSFLMATGKHLVINAIDFPTQVGYGIFPWWHASGGEPWPILKQTGAVWVALGFSWFLTGLVLLGFFKAFRRDATFVEWFFPNQTLLLLTFFVGFGYYLMILPWLFLWLWRGFQELSKKYHLDKLKLCCALLLLITAVAKDVKAFWLVPTQWSDRDPRWSWVATAVPSNEAVYYESLQNYMLAPLRWYDSRRMAVGLTPDEVALEAKSAPGARRWISVPTGGASSKLLSVNGWRAVIREEGQLPTVADLGVEMSDPQKQFLLGQSPPQTLFRRP